MGIPQIRREAELKPSLGKILQKRTVLTFALADKMREKKDVESVHQMRISARRLNTLIKIFRELFPRRELKTYSRTLRTILDVSGIVRENDMLIRMLERYSKKVPAGERTAIELLVARKKHEREKSWKRLITVLATLDDVRVRSGFKKFVELS